MLRQFSLPVCSTSLLDEIISQDVDLDFGPAQWSAYNQLVNVQRLQLESLFNCVLGFNKEACAGLKGAGTGHVRSDILRSILVSLSSLMFLRMSTTITLAIHGPHACQKRARGNFLPVPKFDSAKLVNDEGLASLRADCELVSYLHHPCNFRCFFSHQQVKHGANQAPVVFQILKLIAKLTTPPELTTVSPEPTAPTKFVDSSGKEIIRHKKPRVFI